MISPESIVRSAKDYCSQGTDPLVAIWIREPVRRKQLCLEVRKLSAGLAVVPLVVHGSMKFLHPNALSDDIRGIMDENESVFEEVFAQSDAPPDRTALVLISRTPLGVAQASSPVLLPEWFPRIGGKSIQVSIVELEYEPICSLGAEEASVGALSAALHQLERVLVGRLTSTHRTDKKLGQSLSDHLQSSSHDNVDWEKFLEAAGSFVDRISPPEAYRPSFRSSDSLVSRLLSTTLRTTPDGLGRIGKALANALDLPEWEEMPVTESLPSVLLRPTGRPEARQRFARNCIVTIYATAQYITAAAHADEYGQYTQALVSHTSLNLRFTCDNIVAVIKDL